MHPSRMAKLGITDATASKFQVGKCPDKVAPRAVVAAPPTSTTTTLNAATFGTKAYRAPANDWSQPPPQQQQRQAAPQQQQQRQAAPQQQSQHPAASQQQRPVPAAAARPVGGGMHPSRMAKLGVTDAAKFQVGKCPETVIPRANPPAPVVKPSAAQPASDWRAAVPASQWKAATPAAPVTRQSKPATPAAVAPVSQWRAPAVKPANPAAVPPVTQWRAPAVKPVVAAPASKPVVAAPAPKPIIRVRSENGWNSDDESPVSKIDKQLGGLTVDLGTSLKITTRFNSDGIVRTVVWDSPVASAPAAATQPAAAKSVIPTPSPIASPAYHHKIHPSRWTQAMKEAHAAEQAASPAPIAASAPGASPAAPTALAPSPTPAAVHVPSPTPAPIIRPVACAASPETVRAHIPVARAPSPMRIPNDEDSSASRSSVASPQPGSATKSRSEDNATKRAASFSADARVFTPSHSTDGDDGSGWVSDDEDDATVIETKIQTIRTNMSSKVVR